MKLYKTTGQHVGQSSSTVPAGRDLQPSSSPTATEAVEKTS